MNVEELFEPEDWDTLPDDRNEAFAKLVGIAQNRLHSRTSEIRTRRGADAGRDVLDAQFGFASTLIAVAQQMEIAEFADYHLPWPRDFDGDSYLQITSDLNQFLAKVATASALRRREQSVGLDDKARSRIRGHLHALKTIIDGSSLDAKAKKKLLDRLADFERDLDGRGRINVVAAMLTIAAVLAIPSDMHGSGEALDKLGHNVIKELAEAKRTEDEAREALIPYQPKIASRPPTSRKGLEEIDDDIPF